jgi:tetratricopeptide (TPR) repeat protein
MKAPALTGLLCLYLLAPAAGTIYAADPLVDQGMEAFYNLDYETALSSWEKALAADPSNPQRHNNIAYALLYREMFRNGALESELVSGNNSFIRRAKLEPSLEVEKRFFSEIDRSMELCQAELRVNPRDTVALHALAVAYGLRANYGFLVRKSWRMSLYDSSQARKFDAQVTEIDPNDYDSRLIQGAWDYITGSLSWSMRALGFLAGVHGDKQRGIHTIEEVVQKGKQNREDAEIILCALYRRDGQTVRAIPHVLQLINRFPRNYLIRFELAQMYAATGQRAAALDTIGQIAAMKQQNVRGFDRIPWEKIYYETGNLQFWFDDFDHALENLQRATGNPDQMKDLDLNTGSLAFMRQGQIYDLQKRHNLAIAEYQQAMKFAPEADAARESQHYIGSPYTRAVRTHS